MKFIEKIGFHRKTEDSGIAVKSSRIYRIQEDQNNEKKSIVYFIYGELIVLESAEEIALEVWGNGNFVKECGVGFFRNY